MIDQTVVKWPWLLEFCRHVTAMVDQIEYITIKCDRIMEFTCLINVGTQQQNIPEINIKISVSVKYVQNGDRKLHP